MKIIMTMREIADNVDDWDQFCDAFGWDYYCLNEGLDPNTEQIMTLKQAKALGLIK